MFLFRNKLDLIVEMVHLNFCPTSIYLDMAVVADDRRMRWRRLFLLNEFRSG